MKLKNKQRIHVHDKLERPMSKLYTLLLIASLMLGCTNLTTPKETLQLKHTYIVEWIGEYPLMDYSHLTITLDEHNKAYGFAGCNNWHGTYQLNNNNIQIHNIATTRKLCAPSLMRQERQFIDALATIERWDFSEVKQLRLWPNEGQPIKLWLQDIPPKNHLQ